MSTRETSDGGLNAAESNLGQALASILRVLPWVRQPERAAEVQAALRCAAVLIDAARAAHSGERALVVAPVAAGPVDAEIVAVIAAAVAAVLGQSHRVISVAPVQAETPHLNVWAYEGRSQLFVSHKVR